MASLDSVLLRKNLASGIVKQVGTDTPVGIRLRYLGTGTVTSVTVDNTAEDFEFITSDGGTDTYTVADYATVGALADAINADGIFEAKVLDVLRSNSTDDTFVDGAITASADKAGNVIWDMKMDTSASLELGVVLSPFQEFDAPKGHRVHLQQIVYSVNMGTAAADSVQVYLRKGATETKIYGALSVDTTETTITFASGVGMISGGTDEEIFVRVKDAATLADAAGNFVRVVGIYE